VCDYGNHRVLRWELSSDGLSAASEAGQLVAGEKDSILETTQDPRMGSLVT
ncbi:hypothetical protein Pmar_PMAR013613, partial [Perkinsus marinus ATCC 50983]